MNVDETMRIIKKTIDINAAYKSSITIGDKTTTLTQLTNQNNNRVDIQLDAVRGEISNVNGTVEFIQSTFESSMTSLTQSLNDIIATALSEYTTTTNLREIIEELQTQITVTSSSVTTEFTNKLTEVQNNIDGTISSKFKELYAYIREYMDENGLPVIELGSEQSNLICRITSEKIAFLQNGIEVAYISDDKLFITEAEILTSIIIGNFAFKPRANGNLSFVKVR